MRKSSYIRLALLALPLSLPAPSLDEAKDYLPLAASPSYTVSETSLGRFLNTEIEGRMEKISGHSVERTELSERSHEIAMAIAEASFIHNVDPFLLLSMIEVESRYNATAVGSHGELGLMQIKPKTALWIAPVDDELYACNLHQIRCNVMMGASYVGHLQNKTGTRATIALFREHVLRSYNLGPAKANRLETDRLPASQSEALPYATKIANRADRMRSRYLAVALLQ